MSSEVLSGHLLEDGSGYEITFLGQKVVTTVFGDVRKSFQEAMRKLETAYNMVPKGAAIVPKQRISECRGWLVGGILQDSLRPVYGAANEHGISGYACSIFWILTEEEIRQRALDKLPLPQDLPVRDREI
jgi:hypothetical protein